MRSEGQAWAAAQIIEISSASFGTFEIIETTDPAADDEDLVVMVSVNCRPFQKKDGGIAMQCGAASMPRR